MLKSMPGKVVDSTPAGFQYFRKSVAFRVECSRTVVAAKGGGEQ
jgi:hypothetical protein